MLVRVAEQLGHDPKSIVKNLVKVITTASPRLKFLFSLIEPWAILSFVAYRYLNNFWSSFSRLGSSFLTYSVTIPPEDKLNRQVVVWLGSQGLANKGRNLTTVTNTFGCEAGNEDLKLVPSTGVDHFWFRGRRFTMTRGNRSTEPDTYGRLESGYKGKEAITLSCWSLTGAQPLKALLAHIKEEIRYKDEMQTTVYQAKHGSWDTGTRRPQRNINSVTLPKSVKDDLIKDIRRYLDPATEMWYGNRGIPYRRGYLFWGPPGTGKTSFATAIAGEFGLDIFMISMASGNLDERMLESLFRLTPKRCVLLLEDIDSAGIKREDMNADKKSKLEQKAKVRANPKFWPTSSLCHPLSSFRNDNGEECDDWCDDNDNEDSSPSSGGISLSGLLNVIDGVTSKEGRILIMTSNEPDTLDEALIRPGRIDRPIFFGYCNRKVMAEIFTRMYTKTEDELGESEKATNTDPQIKEMAKTFAERIPECKLSPAEVQGYLLQYSDDPKKAVDNAATWAEGLVKAKEGGKNVVQERSKAAAPDSSSSEPAIDDSSDDEAQIESEVDEEYQVSEDSPCVVMPEDPIPEADIALSSKEVVEHDSGVEDLDDEDYFFTFSPKGSFARQFEEIEAEIRKELGQPEIAPLAIRPAH